MAGKTSWEQALVDQYVDLFEVIYKETYKEYSSEPEEKKAGASAQSDLG